MSVEIDGWTMLPIADVGSTTQIIASRDDDQALTTDIDVVLYTKTPTGWDGFAYDPSVSKEDAMVDLATEFGLADPFGGTWQIDLDPTNATGAPVIPRQPFGKGFFMYDPLYYIANQLPNPDPLAQSAEAAGLPAGSGAINTGSFGGGTNAGGGQSTNCGCDNGCIQTAIADAADAVLIDPSMSSDQIDAVIEADLQLSIGCCLSRRSYRALPSGAWNCSEWRFQGLSGTRCTYRRDVFRQQTRSCTIRCASDNLCTVNRVIQHRIESGSQTAFTTTTTGSCTPPVGVACAPTSIFFSHTHWSPPPPSC